MDSSIKSLPNCILIGILSVSLKNLDKIFSYSFLEIFDKPKQEIGPDIRFSTAKNVETAPVLC